MKQPSSSNAEFDRLAEFLLEDGSSTSLSSGPAASPAFLTTRSALSLMELWSCSPPEAPLAFLRFHHRHGQSTALVTAVVRNEVANLQSTNLLLRESSIGSVLLAHLMELEAEDYLNATLGPFVKEVIREKKGFEVESFWEEDEEARQQNVEKLKDMCQLFLDTFEKSIPQFPNTYPLPVSVLQNSPLRAVLREVATATAQRFPDMPKEEVMRCTVASIVFLRFVCPGLVAYKIKGSEVLPKARGLVLISKVMLTLASGQEFTKKDWLPLNSFIKENQRRMLQLCESLIKVEGEEITAPREEQRRSIRTGFFGSPRGRSSGEIDFPVDEEKELATIFDFFVQHESKMKDALRTQTFTQKKATPRLNTKEDPWIDSFMKCWIADDFIKFDAELMEYVDNGDPNFSKVPVPEAPSSPKEKERCCSAEETTVLKGEAVVIDAEPLTEAEEEFVQQKFEQLIKVLKETSEALKRQDSGSLTSHVSGQLKLTTLLRRIPAAYDANENDNKRKSPRSASSSSSEAFLLDLLAAT
ncbi:GTPase activating factor [Balamuthia mandrillaris]